MAVGVIKRGSTWRLVETATGKVARLGGLPVDGGGHSSKEDAEKQANDVNRVLRSKRVRASAVSDEEE